LTTFGKSTTFDQFLGKKVDSLIHRLQCNVLLRQELTRDTMYGMQTATANYYATLHDLASGNDNVKLS